MPMYNKGTGGLLEETTLLESTVVLMSGEGEISTVYRHRKALPTIRRKMKDRLDDPCTMAIRSASARRQDQSA